MEKILKKLFNLQQGLKVAKTKENKFGGYSYRSAEQILETLKPLLGENACVLFSSDEIRNVGDANYIFTTLTLLDTESGESVSVTANAKEDKMAKGMCSSQMTGVSSSYSKKYALQNMFAIDNSRDADDGEMSMNMFKAQIDMCSSLGQLKNVWENMNDRQQSALKSYFTMKKKELA